MGNGPFARAKEIAAAIAEALALPIEKRDYALSQIKPYLSRGKGRGSPGRNYLSGRGAPSGKYVARECFARGCR